MSLKSIWSALEDSVETLGDNYAYPAMDKTAQEYSLSLDYFTWVAAVWLFGSEAFTIAQFMCVFPYGLAQVNEERFTDAIQQGYLASDGRGGYCATKTGINVANRIFLAANEAIAPLHPMPKETLDRLVNLLNRISNAAFETPEPPVHFILTRKRELYQRMRMVVSLEGFIAHCLEMEGHCDDAYITTWQAHRIEGHTWDALDLFSRGKSLTFSDLHKQLSRRGVTQEVHVEDVNELIRRGWVEESSGLYQITPAGKQIRAEVEAETERIFFLPWSCLSEAELEDLAHLAVKLRDELRILKEMI